ncbi:MAG: PorV/PorQ family protein, partial [Elusimicrobiota bacterium]
MRKNSREAVLAVALLACGAGGALAKTAGTDPFDFLLLDANARAVALGGAYTALADDSNALLYNPAGLGLVRRYEATFMHNQYVDSVSQEYLSLALPQGFGLSFNYLDYGSLTRATISRKDGSLGSFSASDLAASLGYGIRLYRGLSLGLAAKYLRESIYRYEGHGAAFDVGAMYMLQEDPRISFGIAIQNMGTPVRFQGEREQLPLTLRAGAGLGFSLLGFENTLAAEMSKRRLEDPAIGVGMESVVAGMFPVRVGYTTRNDADIGLTGGVGWRYRDLSVDYAIA